jgi:hypothetical protein
MNGEVDLIGLRLVTIKKMHTTTGASQSFIKQLIREKKLTRYRINSAVYVSMAEFESTAKPDYETEKANYEA